MSEWNHSYRHLGPLVALCVLLVACPGEGIGPDTGTGQEGKPPPEKKAPIFLGSIEYPEEGSFKRLSLWQIDLRSPEPSPYFGESRRIREQPKPRTIQNMTIDTNSFDHTNGDWMFAVIDSTATTPDRLRDANVVGGVYAFDFSTHQFPHLSNTYGGQIVWHPLRKALYLVMFLSNTRFTTLSIHPVDPSSKISKYPLEFESITREEWPRPLRQLSERKLELFEFNREMTYIMERIDVVAEGDALLINGDFGSSLIGRVPSVHIRFNLETKQWLWLTGTEKEIEEKQQ